ADRRNRDDGRPEVCLHALFEVGDPRERRDAPPEPLDHDHRGGVSVEQPSPFLDDGIETGLERLGAEQIPHFFVVGPAHGRSTPGAHKRYASHTLSGGRMPNISYPRWTCVFA